MASTPDFEAILGYVEEELGFATSYYNDAYLERRIKARLRRSTADTYAEYLDELRGNHWEARALLDSFSINITGFFRNPAVWERLRPVLRILTRDHREVSVWSAGCADGREPYSLAMLALDDPETDADRVSITATDISEPALETAREATYETTRMTDIGEELSVLADFSPYVDRDGDRFAVRDDVAELVSFRKHDLVQDPPPDEFHLVTCRNLLIYIAPEYKEPVIETLDASLAEGGYLVIGKTEILPRPYKDRYAVVDQRQRIHRKPPRDD